MTPLPEQTPTLIIRCFQTLQDYTAMFETMKHFTHERDVTQADEIWLLQHHPVLTQGQAGKPEHILIDRGLPIVHSDRGGQVTWHGPGQLVGYLLLDLNRLGWNVRTLVSFTEQLMIDLLNIHHITAYAKPKAPGVYVDEKKIGSLGFKIRRGCSYHGFALNIDCGFDGFESINPCGYANLQMTTINQISTCPVDIQTVQENIVQYMQNTQLFSKINVIFQS
ncbi:lipoyl(octanoyl) transferase LipB [Acinetobacter sp. B5B]|uniref:lipoyl(octanoyl) transferase LipB n=1 Tax=Acinetobacter baretiae TaxID=2605383 RepID=UPI0018C2E281|nr:lipoyl(octanoyl) transferase LipB [Acinetobacter baretiae]MBF7683369.1 lipoyl(octanoyl) transferase LipB [Acinetobacter baretiae]MBF7684350.1 lipoyl(octanoyl) transferase LipB [Acinetobacter baretiae]